jgi:hypothetical protein
MGYSSLVTYVKLSPNMTSPRTKTIMGFAIHVMAGNLSIETCGALFAKEATEASSQYGIGTDGRIACYVDENNRAWCTSSPYVDHRVITIEIANNGGSDEGWPISDKAYASLISLLVDCCQRHKIKELRWSADETLKKDFNSQNITVHRWFAAKACPGDYVFKRLKQITDEVNARLEDDEMKDPSEWDDDYTDAVIARIRTRQAKQPISGYAEDIGKEAVKEGLFADGDADGQIDAPQADLKRQESAVLFARFEEQIVKKYGLTAK